MRPELRVARQVAEEPSPDSPPPPRWPRWGMPVMIAGLLASGPLAVVLILAVSWLARVTGP